MGRLLIRGCLFAGLAAVMLAGAIPAHAQTETPTPTPTPPGARGGEAEINQPGTNDVIAGVVQILGTAAAPDFSHYEMAWAPDPQLGEDPWQSIQPPITQQVRDGVLGLWDTSTVPDGVYQIRLTIVRRDETTLETVVRVEVVNATPTPPPTLTVTPSITPLPGPATAGPSPTPLIQQPPTRTPRPTQTPGGATATPVPLIGRDSPFEPSRLRLAACRGSLLTLLGFAAIGLYGVLRAASRGELRGALRRFRSDVVNPVLKRGRRGK